MGTTIDFDAYRQERANDNIKIKAFGEELELPPSPPLSSMIEIIDMNEKMESEAFVPQKQIEQMLKLSLGKNQYKTLMEKGITIEESEWLVKKLWSIYNKSNEEENEQDDTKNVQNSPSQKNGDS